MKFRISPKRTTTTTILFFVLFEFFSLIAAQIQVVSPASLVSALEALEGKSSVIPGTTATFGAPTYGDSIVGRLFYAPSNTSFCTNDYEQSLQEQIRKVGSTDLRQIFLVDRGECTFTTKVRIAQTLGAHAVIMSDSSTSLWSRKDLGHVIMAHDGTGSDILIPSIMITHNDGTRLRNALKESEVVVQLQWSLPQKSMVSLDFWTESGSIVGQRFLKDFAYYANLLRGKILFTPHFVVYGIKSSSVPQVPEYRLCLSPDRQELCSNPPDVAGTGISGYDVLQEDVRLLCLWEATAKEVDGMRNSKFSAEWWEYIRKFAEKCPLLQTTQGGVFGPECSYEVMKSIPLVDVAQVRECVQERAADLLAKEKSNAAWGNTALRINGAKFSGILDPLQVSKAVCSAFETAPKVCDSLVGHAIRTLPKVSTAAILGGVVGTLACGGLVLYLYQSYVHKSLKAALRHEVMMEVKSQMQDYERLEEETFGKAKQNSPLIL